MHGHMNKKQIVEWAKLMIIWGLNWKWNWICKRNCNKDGEEVVVKVYESDQLDCMRERRGEREIKNKKTKKQDPKWTIWYGEDEKNKSHGNALVPVSRLEPSRHLELRAFWLWSKSKHAWWPSRLLIVDRACVWLNSLMTQSSVTKFTQELLYFQIRLAQ